jgi:hypothetical protein
LSDDDDARHVTADHAHHDVRAQLNETSVLVEAATRAPAAAAALDPTVVATSRKAPVVAATTVAPDRAPAASPGTVDDAAVSKRRRRRRHRVDIMTMIIMANILLLFGCTATIVYSSDALQKRNMNIY